MKSEDYIPLNIGDKVNIDFIIPHDSNLNLQNKLLGQFGEGVKDVTADTSTFQIVSNAIVMRTQKKIGILAVQMTPDDAEMIDWLTGVQIPYKIEKVE
jgi:hypothetical protein